MIFGEESIMKRLIKLIQRLRDNAEFSAKQFAPKSYGEGCYSSEAAVYNSVLLIIQDKQFRKDIFKMYGIK